MVPVVGVLDCAPTTFATEGYSVPNFSARFRVDTRARVTWFR